MSDLQVKAVLTMDNKSLVGGAAEGVVSLDALKAAANDAGVAGVEMGAGLGVASKANATVTQSSVAATASLKAAAAAEYEYSSAATGAAAVAVAAHAAEAGSSERMRETLHLAIEGSRGEYTRMTSSIVGLLDSLGLLTPAALLVEASFLLIVGGYAALEIQAARSAEQNRLLEAEISGVGRMSGIASGQIESAASKAAAAQNVSIGTAQQWAQSYAFGGKVAGDVLTNLTAITTRFAEATGQEAKAAVEELAKDFADPAKGASDLQEKLGLLNAEQLKHIQQLSAEGDRMGAQRALYAALDSAIDETANTHVHGLVKAWQDVWTWAGNAYHEMVIAAGGGSLSDQLINAQQTLARHIQMAQGGNRGAASFIPDDIKTVNDLIAAINKLGDAHTREAAAANANQESQWIDQTSAALNPFQKQLDDLDVQYRRNYADSVNMTLSASDRAKASANLTDIDKKYTQVLAEQAKQQQFLTEGDKQAAEARKALAKEIANSIIDLQKNVDAEDLERDTSKQLADNIDLTTGARKKMADQLALEKALLPFNIALRKAESNGFSELATTIRGLIKEYTDAANAKSGFDAKAEAIADIKSQYAQLSGVFADVKVQYANSVKDAVDWRDQTIDAFKKEGAYTEQWGEEIDAIFKDKMDKALTDSLSKAQDWASGVKLAMHDMSQDLSDTAKKAADDTKQLSQTFEDTFVNAAMGSKNAFQDLLQFLEKLILRTIYEKLLAQSMNGLSGDIVNGLGGILGGGGGGGSGLGDFGLDLGGDSGGGWLGMGMVPGGATPNTTRASIRTNAAVLGIPSYQSALRATSGDMALMRPRSMQLPAGMAMAGGKMPAIEVNVHNLEGQTSTSKTSRDPNGNVTIDVLVTQIENKISSNVQNGKGSLGKTMQNTFDLKRNVK